MAPLADSHRHLGTLPAYPFYGGPALNADISARSTVDALLADLDAVTKRVERGVGRLARVGNKEAQQQMEAYSKAIAAIDAGSFPLEKCKSLAKRYISRPDRDQN